MGAEVGAHVVGHVRPQPEKPSVRAERQGELVPLFAGVVDGAQVLDPVLDPLDGTPEPERRAGDEEVLGIELAAGPEPAPHVRLDEADAMLRPTEHRGEDAAVEVGDLGRTPDGEAALAAGGAPLRHGDEPPGLHRNRRVAAGAEGEPHDAFRPGEGGVDVPEPFLDDGGEVVGGVVKKRRGGRRGRVGRRGQRLEFRLHPFRGVFGGGPAPGDDEGDGLSHVAHPVGREGELEVAQQPVVGDEADRDGAQRFPELARPEDRLDPRHGPRRRCIESANPRVSNRAPDDRRVEHAGHVHVVHVVALAADAPGVLEPPDRAADGGKRIGSGRAAEPLGPSRGRRRRLHAAY